MKILITNDDGYLCEGMRLLAIELSKKHECTIVAPLEEQSAKSQALNLADSRSYKSFEFEGYNGKAYAIDGTPADCTRIGKYIFAKDAQIVVSGINRGLNAGQDIAYSGTVGACFEANRLNLGAIAFSTTAKNKMANFKGAVTHALSVFEKYAEIIAQEKNLTLNVNIPNSSVVNIIGEKLCKVGINFEDSYSKGYDEIFLNKRNPMPSPHDTDRALLKLGFVTISPIKLEFNDNNLLEKFVNGYK